MSSAYDLGSRSGRDFYGHSFSKTFAATKCSGNGSMETSFDLSLLDIARVSFQYSKDDNRSYGQILPQHAALDG